MSLRLVLVMLVVLLIPPDVAWAGDADTHTVELTGYAYSLDGNQRLYTEHHVITHEGDRVTAHRVEYRRPDGTLFAEKTLDYGDHPFAPDFRLTDLRDGYVEGGTETANGYQLFRREGTDQPVDTDTIKPGPDLVSDAGFDRFVRAHLTDILRDGKIGFRLAVAGRLSAFRFRAEPTARDTLFGRDAVTLRIEPATLLSLLVDPIDVTYDIQTGRLLRYAGISNIRSSSGERLDARIDFPTDGVPAGWTVGSARP